MSFRIFFLAGLVFPLAVLVAAAPADSAGWIVLWASWLVPFAYRPFRRRPRLLALAVAISLAYSALAVANAYFVIIPGADGDAARFLRLATLFADSGTGPEFRPGSTSYLLALTTLFSIFGSSPLLPSALNVLAVTLTLPLMHSLRSIFSSGNDNDTQAVPFLLLNFLPSAVSFRIPALREAWECLLFTAAIYCLCSAFARPGLIRLVGFFLLLLAGGILHPALSLAGGTIFIFATIRSQWSNRSAGPNRIAYSMLLAILAIPLALGALRIAGDDRRVAGVADGYRSGGYEEALGELQFEGRGGATYASAPGMSHPALRIPAGFFYYFAAPLPWQVRNSGDALALLENVIRFSVIFSFALSIRKSRGVRREALLVALGSVLVLELVWSAGTSNWGTSMRHHIPSLAVLCSGAFLAGSRQGSYRSVSSTWRSDSV